MNKQKKWTVVLLSTLFLFGCASNQTSEADVADTATQQSSLSSLADISSEQAEETEEEAEEETDMHIAEVEAETGLHVVDNPESMLVYVNKKRKLPDGYEPNDLVVPDVRHRYEAGHMETKMRKEAANALKNLFEGAQEDGYELMTISGYRSYERQNTIYTNQVNAYGLDYANQYSARPGTSEHQTGLSIDVRYADDSKESKLEQSFGDTDMGIWLAEHAHEYGFVIRYPRDKEEVTGYSYEPWHIRYVGVDVAAKLYAENLTLEEYFGYDQHTAPTD